MIRVPVGPDADRWSTVAGCKVVLAVARTVVSTTRLLDALEVFRADFRVQVVFAIDETSAFSDGVEVMLLHQGARMVPWEQVPHIHVDLVIVASENADLAAVDAPVVVLPHGVGFHKYVPDSRQRRRRLSGLVRPEQLDEDRLRMVVSHPRQVEQLADVDPRAAKHAVVVGDPTHDRILASRRLRELYRRRLGVGHGQRLVVLSSTWGDGSLLGRWRTLPANLLAELPADEYRVAAILHPNVWYGHGVWQVRTWLSDAYDAGLVLVPPNAGWQATLVAADLLIGDHGSVTLYGAALGVPTLLAAVGGETVPGTVISELVASTPRLRAGGSLRLQIARARADPGRARQLTDAAFDRVGQAIPTLRRLCYQLLDLVEPAPAAPVSAWPPPPADHVPASAYQIYTELSAAGVVTVRRYPAAVPDAGTAEAGAAIRHLAAYTSERDLRLVDNASVVVSGEVVAADWASGHAADILQQYPGSRIAAVATPKGCLLGLRDGPLIHAEGDADPMLLAAAGYALLRADRLDLPSVTVRAGTRETGVRLVMPGG